MGAGTWESHHAIQGLMFRYAECVDLAEFDGLAALFEHGRLTSSAGADDAHATNITMTTAIFLMGGIVTRLRWTSNRPANCDNHPVMTLKSVVITGASTGIGASCAHYLDARGFRVFAAVRKQEDAERLESEGSDNLSAVILDVTRQETIERSREIVEGELGERGLDALVNNAGINVSGPLEFVSLDRLREQFEVNVFGQVAVTQAFLEMLRQARGRVVNISSIAGRVTTPLIGPYSMSKFALESFTDALRGELLPWGVDVISVEPGAINTPIWTKALDAQPNRVDSLSERAKALYGQRIENLRKLAQQAADRAIPADVVSKVIHHALTARSPRVRYLVGRDAYARAIMSRVLPTRWLDKLFLRLVPH